MPSFNSRLFKILHRIHIYAGLFSSAYLLIVGLSALNFQHNFLNKNPVDTTTYQETVLYDPTLKPDTLAQQIARSLKIIGHTPPWDFRNDSTGFFSFKIYRPARVYEVSLNIWIFRGKPCQ